MNYWKEKYESFARKNARAEDPAAWNTLDLLAEYSGFFKSFIFPGPWGGEIQRFFTGRWNTHYANDIELAIGCFYEMATPEAVDSAFHSTDRVMGYVKRQLEGKVINPAGDLAKVLEVIKIKTGVDFYNLPPNNTFEARTRSLN
jgi:hypothetical protein